ncbi:MAG: sigma-70 family RNA polymerase sigma factor [Parabacteroides gordonii]|nr:sigma-70 family RNA polymerase sigma factor [Parabacteroides gordonii]
MIRDIRRFDNWFSSSYYQIRTKLEGFPRFDEDAFHDAYLAIRINLLFERVEVVDFESYFEKCYKNISRKRIRLDQKYCHPDDIYFQMLSENEPVELEDLLALDQLAHDILSFVKQEFSNREYRLFRLKLFETQCSYKDLSDYTGLASSTIYRKVNSISNAIRNDFEFVWRNAQLIAN